MPLTFTTVGLIGRQRKNDIRDTLLILKKILQNRGLAIVVESDTAATLPHDNLPIYSRDELGKHCDLIIVVGGDGSLLNAAKGAVDSNTPLLGINKGRLGFLTDIHPNELDNKVNDVLEGKYLEEFRFLLAAEVIFEEKTLTQEIALNDVVLMPGDIAHMIEFSISIDGQFVCSQRADGLIVSTPTGSTAYALSGGGPILHPQLDAIVLVPMFPHTLSARPIVVNANSVILIAISETNETEPRLSCDGEKRIKLPPGSFIQIKKKIQRLRLFHPDDYNYFQTLRTKLHWSTKIS